MKSEKTLRKSLVGGFNRRDVVEYVTQAARERREECDALRSGADRLRAERDAAISARDALEESAARYSASEALRQQVQKDADLKDAELSAAKSEIERLTSELEAYKIQSGALAEELTAMGAARERMDAMETEAEARVREAEEGIRAAEDRARAVEMRAQADAEAVIVEAQARAERSREELVRLIEDIKARYEVICGEAQSSSLSVVRELDNMRRRFADFADAFAGLDDKLDELASDPRPHVRQFVPRQFEDSPE